MLKRKTARKIAFVGTSCVGKTTLLEELGRRLATNPQIAIVPEAARIFFTANPNTTERFGRKAQGQIQLIALQQEKEAYNTEAKVILCDRSVINAVVYLRTHGDKGGAAELLDRISFWLPTYTTFLLLNPADIPYKTDNVRQETEELRQSFHQAYLDFFEECGIPYELLSGSLEERIARVDEIIAE